MARLALGPLASWHMCFGLSWKPVGFQETAGGIWFPPFQVHAVPDEASCLPHHVSAFLNLSCTNQRSSPVCFLISESEGFSEAGLHEIGFCSAYLDGVVPMGK